MFKNLPPAKGLDKLLDVGVSTEALQWFSSYLSNRNQVVCINSTLSDALPLVSGIPQGSIMGPLLFTIYVNDIPTIPKKTVQLNVMSMIPNYTCLLMLKNVTMQLLLSMKIFSESATGALNTACY